MNIDMSSGAFYIGKDFIGSAIPYFDECISADTNPTLSFNTQSTVELSTNMIDFNNSLFEQLAQPKLMESYVYWNRPIKIQARWHKKNRINKKWLKRYGMKDDTLKMKGKVEHLTYTPGERHPEYDTFDGLCCGFDNYEFMISEWTEEWRPDQKRRRLKVEL